MRVAAALRIWQKKSKRPTLVFYEAPHRIVDTLADLEFVFGPDLRVVVARELTKIHEEFLRGPVEFVRQRVGRARSRSRRNHFVD